MTSRVEQGKGQKDRYAMLSPILLERLRTWWRVARARQALDGGWLFPGLNPIEPLSARQMPAARNFWPRCVSFRRNGSKTFSS
jgi:integrase